MTVRHRLSSVVTALVVAALTVLLVGDCVAGCLCSFMTEKGDVPCLRRKLRSKDRATREQAAWELWTLGGDAAQAAPDLERTLGDAHAGVRIAAAGALGAIDVAKQAKALPILLAALRDPAHRGAAAGYLGVFQAYSNRVVPALIAALKDSRGFERATVAGAIIAIGPQAVPAVCDALKDPDESLRRVAAIVLGRSAQTGNTAAALQALSEAVNDSSAEVRSAAVQAIAMLQKPEATPSPPPTTTE
jgi:HEAT repeat protein